MELWVLPGAQLVTAVLTQNGQPLQWLHPSLGGTPRVYTPIDQMADMIQRGRDSDLCSFGKDPDKIVTPYRLRDLTWVELNNPRLAIALEGFLGQLDCHFGPHRWVSAFLQLEWQEPCLFLKNPIPKVPNVFTDGGHLGAAVAIFHPGTPSPEQFLHPCEGSAQYKELMAIALALKNVPACMNLFSDSLYAVNLLPGLVWSHI